MLFYILNFVLVVVAFCYINLHTHSAVCKMALIWANVLGGCVRVVLLLFYSFFRLFYVLVEFLPNLLIPVECSMVIKQNQLCTPLGDEVVEVDVDDNVNVVVFNNDDVNVFFSTLVDWML